MPQLDISSFIVQLIFFCLSYKWCLALCLIIGCGCLPNFIKYLINIKYTRITKTIISICSFLLKRMSFVLIITICGESRGKTAYHFLDVLLFDIIAILSTKPYRVLFGFDLNKKTYIWVITLWPLYFLFNYIYFYTFFFILLSCADIIFGLQGMWCGIYCDLMINYNSGFHAHSTGLFSNVAYCVGENPIGENPNLNIPLAPAEAINFDHVVDNQGSAEKRVLSEDTAKHPPSKRLRLSPNADVGNTGNLENDQSSDIYTTDILAQDIRRLQKDIDNLEEDRYHEAYGWGENVENAPKSTPNPKRWLNNDQHWPSLGVDGGSDLLNGIERQQQRQVQLQEDDFGNTKPTAPLSVEGSGSILSAPLINDDLGNTKPAASFSNEDLGNTKPPAPSTLEGSGSMLSASLPVRSAYCWNLKWNEEDVHLSPAEYTDMFIKDILYIVESFGGLCTKTALNHSLLGTHPLTISMFSASYPKGGVIDPHFCAYVVKECTTAKLFSNKPEDNVGPVNFNTSFVRRTVENFPLRLLNGEFKVWHLKPNQILLLKNYEIREIFMPKESFDSGVRVRLAWPDRNGNKDTFIILFNSDSKGVIKENFVLEQLMYLDGVGFIPLKTHISYGYEHSNCKLVSIAQSIHEPLNNCSNYELENTGIQVHNEHSLKSALLDFLKRKK